MRVTGVVTRNRDRAQLAKLDFPEARVFKTSEQAFEHQGDFELAVIATASGSHFSLALQSLHAGLHVVIDKPAAGSVSEIEILGETRKRLGRQVHVFQNRRWDSNFLTLRKHVESEIIGNVHTFESRLESYRPVPSLGWRDSPKPESLGGVLWDLGSHLVDQASQLMGPAKSVYAHGRSLRNPLTSTDDVFICLQHTSGSQSLLFASKLVVPTAARLTAIGTLGSISINHGDSQEEVLRDGDRFNISSLGFEPEEASASIINSDAAQQIMLTKVPLERGRWSDFYPGVRESIHSDTASPVSLSDVWFNTRILEGAITSIEKRAEIDLDTNTHPLL